MKNKTDKTIVKPVVSKRDMDNFINLPRRIYAGNRYYVPDLDMDVRATFSEKDNPALEFSDIQPFVAYDEKNAPVGRIVAIINRKANEKWGTRVARFSFIEFIDDKNVSAALLKTVEDWGRQHGMDEVEGPLGVVDFDKEGMLIEGFNHIGSMTAIYNPEYYPRHMEALGYGKKVDWLQIKLNVPDEIPAKYARVAKLSGTRYGLTTRPLTRNDLKQGYGHEVFKLLNEAYSPLFGYSSLSDRQIDQFVNKYMPLVDLRMVSMVINKEQELIGIAITMGSLTHALQKSGGKLFPLGWFHLLKALKFKHEDKVELLLIAVRPDYQGRGVNALFFNELIPVYQKFGYKWAETGPQLEDNVKELSQWKSLNPQTTTRRRCFCKKI